MFCLQRPPLQHTTPSDCSSGMVLSVCVYTSPCASGRLSTPTFCARTELAATSVIPRWHAIYADCLSSTLWYLYIASTSAPSRSVTNETYSGFGCPREETTSSQCSVFDLVPWFGPRVAQNWYDDTSHHQCWMFRLAGDHIGSAQCCVSSIYTYNVFPVWSCTYRCW